MCYFSSLRRLELDLSADGDRNWGTLLLGDTATIGDPRRRPWLIPQPPQAPRRSLHTNPSISQPIRPRNYPSPLSSTTTVPKPSALSRRGPKRLIGSCKSSLTCRFVSLKNSPKLQFGEADMSPNFHLLFQLQ